MEIVCTRCNSTVKHFEAWILDDIKDFTARKLFFTNCPKCQEVIVALYEKRISDNKVFINTNIQGLNAVKTIYRERKRVVTKIMNVKADNLYGWIYGVNKEIRNKKKEITQVRQYSSDFNGNKTLSKKIVLRGK